jgi:hypothetical protein
VQQVICVTSPGADVAARQLEAAFQLTASITHQLPELAGVSDSSHVLMALTPQLQPSPPSSKQQYNAITNHSIVMVL